VSFLTALLSLSFCFFNFSLVHARLKGAPRRVVTGSGDVMDQQREKSLTMDDLYGEGKAYPDPYNAGEGWLRVFVFMFLHLHPCVHAK